MRKLSGTIDGDLITRNFFPEYVGHEKGINSGNCFNWAYVAYRLYKNVQLWQNSAHAFVKQNGKFYDSESPFGTNHYANLGCNTRCSWCCRNYRVSCAILVEHWYVDCRFYDRLIAIFWRKRNNKKLINRKNQQKQLAA